MRTRVSKKVGYRAQHSRTESPITRHVLPSFQACSLCPLITKGKSRILYFCSRQLCSKPNGSFISRGQLSNLCICLQWPGHPLSHSLMVFWLPNSPRALWIWGSSCLFLYLHRFMENQQSSLHNFQDTAQGSSWHNRFYHHTLLSPLMLLKLLASSLLFLWVLTNHIFHESVFVSNIFSLWEIKLKEASWSRLFSSVSLDPAWHKVKTC